MACNTENTHEQMHGNTLWRLHKLRDKNHYPQTERRGKSDLNKSTCGVDFFLLCETWKL